MSALEGVNMENKSAVLVTSVVVAVLVSISACQPGDKPSTSTQESKLAGAPKSDVPSAADLPLSKFRHGDEYTALSNRATSAKANECLAEQKLDKVFDASPVTVPPTNFLAAIGVVDEANSPNYGVPQGEVRLSERHDPLEYERWGLPQPVVDAIVGTQEKRGCLTQAAKAVHVEAVAPTESTIPKEDRMLLTQVFEKADMAALKAPEVVSASAAWVKCVDEAGFRAETPVAGVVARKSHKQGESLSSSDRADALRVDVGCKRSSGLAAKFVQALKVEQQKIWESDSARIVKVFEAEKKQMVAMAKIAGQK